MYKYIMTIITATIVFLPHKVFSDQGQISLSLNPGFTIFTKNQTYDFNNGPKFDIAIGYDASDESNVNFDMGINRFQNNVDNNLLMNLIYTGINLKQYLNGGIEKGYFTGGLNFVYANFSGTPSLTPKPADDMGVLLNAGVGIDVMASSSFFFGPLLKYEGVILQKTYLSLLSFQIDAGFLF